MSFIEEDETTEEFKEKAAKLHWRICYDEDDWVRTPRVFLKIEPEFPNGEKKRLGEAAHTLAESLRQSANQQKQDGWFTFDFNEGEFRTGFNRALLKNHLELLTQCGLLEANPYHRLSLYLIKTDEVNRLIYRAWYKYESVHDEERWKRRQTKEEESFKMWKEHKKLERLKITKERKERRGK